MHRNSTAFEGHAVEPVSPFVFRFGGLGDTVMQTAVLSLLHARFGKPCHVVSTNPLSREIYQGNCDVGRLWILPKRLPFLCSSAWIEIVAALRREPRAPVYIQVFHPREVRAIRAILALSRIDRARCLALDARECRRVLASGEPSWMEYLLQFSRRTPPALGGRAEPAPDTRNRLPFLAMDEQARGTARAALQSEGWRRGQPIVLISPGNHRTLGRRRRRKYRGRDPKSWALENWRELLRAIHERTPDALICLCGSPGERPLLAQIRAASAVRPPQLAVLATPVRVFMGVCELASSMVAIDSGLAHVAAAMRLPLVVLFGGDRRETWLPRGLGQPVIGIGGPPRSWHVNDVSVDEACRGWESVHFAGRAAGGEAPVRSGADLGRTLAVAQRSAAAARLPIR
jgi:ADP-heptose:LPS heptosyltransferase